MLAGENLPTVYVGGDNASLDGVGEIVQCIGQVDTTVIFVGAAVELADRRQSVGPTRSDLHHRSDLRHRCSTRLLVILWWSGPGK